MASPEKVSNLVRRHATRRRAVLLAASGVLLVPASASAAQPADTVFRGGPIHTMDARDRTVRALAVRSGHVVYAGDERGVRAYIGRGTDVQELRGRAILPGLQDAHLHVLAGGAQLRRCNLEYAALTVSELQARIQRCLDADGTAAGDRPLEVVNWYRQNMKPVGTDGSRQILDALKTSRPIVVGSSDGHSTLVNTRALQLAGVTATTPDPASGRIDRDAAGQPTGILEDTAGDLATALIPAPTAADDVSAMEAALAALRKDGVTSLGAQQTSVAELRAFRTLYRKGRLTARVNAAPDVSETAAAKDPAAAVAGLVRLRDRFETGPVGVRPGIRVRNAGELFQDGVLQAPAHTASLLSPYFDAQGDPTDDAGPAPYFPDRVMRDLVVRLVRHGFSPQIHAIGDRAVRATLDDYAAVRERLGGRPARLAIAHAEIVDPADLKRFRTLDVTPVMSFQWGKPAPDSIDAAQVFMGPERFSAIEPEGRLQDTGARIAFGSDWPVDELGEFFALEVGITRRNDPASGYAGRLNSDPGLTRRTAFRAITTDAAYEMGTEARTGSLERGKNADLIVVDADPLRVAASRISETKVLRTVVGGKTVYRAR